MHLDQVYRYIPPGDGGIFFAKPHQTTIKMFKVEDANWLLHIIAQVGMVLSVTETISDHPSSFIICIIFNFSQKYNICFSRTSFE